MGQACERNNVSVSGEGQAMVFAHGFGCDQEMWRFVAPAFAERYRIVLYDLTGAGKSDLSAYDFDRYRSLSAHAEDLIEICDELDIRDAVLVGHSVSATIVALAANARPDVAESLILLAPSPCFLNDGDYHGGFEMGDLEGLVAFMEENYLGWSEQLAPTIAKRPADDPSAQMLTQSFCRTDPDIAQHFGRVTFLADHREDFKRVSRPSLIAQVAEDSIAPTDVGRWMADNAPGSRLVMLDTVGHCPHLTDPEATIAAMNDYLAPSDH